MKKTIFYLGCVFILIMSILIFIFAINLVTAAYLNSFVYDAPKVTVLDGYKITESVFKGQYNAVNDSTPEDRKTVQKIPQYKQVAHPYIREGISINTDSGVVHYDGFVNVVNNKVCLWNIDVGQRNLKEYPCCLDYEIKKGICKVIYFEQ